MNKLSFRWTILVAVTLLAAAAISAQRSATSQKYLISAKAGGVNYTQGAVGIARNDRTGGLLIMGDEIEVGEKVSTGADGRVEILLNPGSYLRLGPDSSMEFKTTALDDLQIKLNGGSAIFEVFATKEFTVSLFTPKGKVTLVESGVYRIDMPRDGVVTVAVSEGKALVGTTVVKEGRVATVNSASVDVAKFDRGKRDDLAEWSRTRAKDLAKTSSTLKNRDVRASLLNSFYSRRWDMFSSFGLWVFDPFMRRYCFLPFGYGWNSPYGYGFGTSIWWYNLPPVVFNPPTGTPTGNPPIRVPTRNDVDETRRVAPPFTKIDRGGGEIRGPIRNGQFPAEPSKPVRDMPPPPTPIIVMPPAAPQPTGKISKKPDGR